MSLTPRSHRRLVGRLLGVRRSIAGWEDSIRDAICHGFESAGVPTQAQAMLALLADARGAVDHRLTELGIDENTQAAEWRTRTRRAHAASGQPATAAIRRLCVEACHACGRALGVAFRVAQAVSDALSAQILYRALRAFEKQIWVLNPHHA